MAHNNSARKVDRNRSKKTNDVQRDRRSDECRCLNVCSDRFLANLWLIDDNHPINRVKSALSIRRSHDETSTMKSNSDRSIFLFWTRTISLRIFFWLINVSFFLWETFCFTYSNVLSFVQMLQTPLFHSTFHILKFPMTKNQQIFHTEDVESLPVLKNSRRKLSSKRFVPFLFSSPM